MEEREFLKWRSSLKEWCLFFDGASKGNLGQAGGGGVIDPSGKIHKAYAWGLGHASNNQVEFLSLWQGLTQVLKMGIQKIMIFGDYKQVVDAFNTKNIPKDIILAQLYKKSLLLLLQFKEYQLNHVLRFLNEQADKEENSGSLLRKGHLKVNEEASHHTIP